MFPLSHTTLCRSVLLTRQHGVLSVNPLSHTTPVCHPRLVNAGKEFRFLKPKQSAPEAEVVKSALKALGPRKALACRVIGGFPIGREFKKPITLKVN